MCYPQHWRYGENRRPRKLKVCRFKLIRVINKQAIQINCSLPQYIGKHLYFLFPLRISHQICCKVYIFCILPHNISQHGITSFSSLQHPYIYDSFMPEAKAKELVSFKVGQKRGASVMPLSKWSPF